MSIETSTLNTGNPYISSGVISNDNGFIIGKMTTGVELVDIDRELGFTRVK